MSRRRPPPASIKDLLRRGTETHADRRLFGRWGDGGGVEAWTSYGQLDASARRIAARLQALRAEGERALLIFPPGPDYIAAFWGCIYARTIAVPAYPPDPSRLERTLERLRAIIADSQATIVLTTRALASMADAVVRIAPELQALRWVATDDGGEAHEWSEPEIRGEDICFLQYTSGSTAAPKGVMVTHANLLHNAESLRVAQGYGPDTRMVAWLPPYHDMGLISSIVQPVYSDFTCVHLTPTQFLLRPLRWLQAITSERATHSGGPNFAYDLCSSKITAEQKQSLDLSSWELAFSGAEPIRADTLDRFARSFAGCGFDARAYYPCYGLAEATLIVTGIEKGAGHQVVASPEADGSRSVVGSGHLVIGGELVVVNTTTAERVAEGQLGEIWVRSESVAAGYWNRPLETAETFAAFTKDGAGPFLRTGDLGFLRAGELFVTGRCKELIISRGRKHFPTDIEASVEAAHWSSPHHRAGGSAVFSSIVDGEERLFVAMEIERRQAERRRGGSDANERRRGTDRRARPFTYRRAGANGAEGRAKEEDDLFEEIVRSVRAVVAANHGVEAYGVFLLRAGSIPKTSSGKKQRVLCRERLLAGKGGHDVLHVWLQGPHGAARLARVA